MNLLTVASVQETGQASNQSAVGVRQLKSLQLHALERVSLPDWVTTITFGGSQDFESSRLTVHVSSPIHPERTLTFDLSSGEAVAVPDCVPVMPEAGADADMCLTDASSRFHMTRMKVCVVLRAP